jgi:hypothetical protein
MNVATVRRIKSGETRTRCSCSNSAASIPEGAVIAVGPLRARLGRSLEGSRGDRAHVYDIDDDTTTELPVHHSAGLNLPACPGGRYLAAVATPGRRGSSRAGAASATHR